MLTAKVFQSGNSQAIRIPSEYRTDKKEFYIRRIGEGYVIMPTDDPWFPFRMTIGTFPEDFMEDRDLEQPSILDAPKKEEL